MSAVAPDRVRSDEPVVDPGIEYPCYKSFDDLIDIGRLKSLDAYMTERVQRYARLPPTDYFENEHPLDANSPRRTSVREIWLSQLKSGVPYEYLDLDCAEVWERAPDADAFGEFMDFVETLPFKATGRMLIIYDDSGHAVPAHRDHLYTDLCHEFIWLRTNLAKPFYMLNPRSGARRYVESYSAWFDTVNQYHGSDAVPGLSFSVRIDGVFTDALRAAIPMPRVNPASAAALWACRGG